MQSRRNCKPKPKESIRTGAPLIDNPPQGFRVRGAARGDGWDCVHIAGPPPSPGPPPSHDHFAKVPHIDVHLKALRDHLTCATGRYRHMAHRDHGHSALNRHFCAAVWRNDEPMSPLASLGRNDEEEIPGQARNDGHGSALRQAQGPTCPIGTPSHPQKQPFLRTKL